MQAFWIPLFQIILVNIVLSGDNAVVIALDRQEKATENGQDVDHSAVQYVRQQLGLQVCAIARLADLLHYLAMRPGSQLGAHHAAVLAYRRQYGVD